MATNGEGVVSIQGTVASKDKAIEVTDLAQRHPGNTPLLVAVPTESGAFMWLRAGKVRDSDKFRKLLAEAGCTTT
jgi:hypothetical protein